MANVIEVRIPAEDASAEPGSAIAELGGALHAALTARLGELAAALRDVLPGTARL
jgi:hypothetical protein